MKVVIIDGIGEVKFKKHSRAKHIKIRVVPSEGVMVTIPTYLNYEFGINAVMGKYEWILIKLAEQQEKAEEKHLIETDFPYTTHAHFVEISFNGTKELIARKQRNRITIYIPSSTNILDVEVQRFIWEKINKVYKTEAKVFLSERTRFFADQHSLTIKRITIRGQKTRWGSCSHDNNINLNFNLMKIPKHLIDYVILHELAHTKEKNHGPGFWNLLDTFTGGNAKKMDKELKQYNHQVA